MEIFMLIPLGEYPIEVLDFKVLCNFQKSSSQVILFLKWSIALE